MSTYRDDRGFAITTLLLLVSVATAVIVGGSSTVAAVQNRADIVEASDRMYQVSQDINARTADDDSPRAQALRDYAEQMRSTSVAMTAEANKDVYTNVRNNVGDAVLTPLQGGAVITGAKFLWDVKTGWELGDTAMKAWDITDPGTNEVMDQLKAMGIDRDYDDPVEQAVLEAKLKGTRLALAETDPGLSPDEIDSLAKIVLGDIEAAGAGGNGATDDFANGFYASLGEQLGFNVPDGAAVGDVTGGEGVDTSSGDTGDDTGDAGATAGTESEALTVLTYGSYQPEEMIFKSTPTRSVTEYIDSPDFDDDTGWLAFRRYSFTTDGKFYGMKNSTEEFSGTYTFDGTYGTCELTYSSEYNYVRYVEFYLVHVGGKEYKLYVLERWEDVYDETLVDRITRMSAYAW